MGCWYLQMYAYILVLTSHVNFNSDSSLVIGASNCGTCTYSNELESQLSLRNLLLTLLEHLCLCVLLGSDGGFKLAWDYTVLFSAASLSPLSIHLKLSCKWKSIMYSTLWIFFLATSLDSYSCIQVRISKMFVQWCVKCHRTDFEHSMESCFIAMEPERVQVSVWPRWITGFVNSIALPAQRVQKYCVTASHL